MIMNAHRIVKHGDKIRAQILDAGVKIWARDGAARLVTARRVGLQLGMTGQAVYYHFKTAELLLDAIAAHAVETENAAVIAQLILSAHPRIATMPQAAKEHFLLSAAASAKA